MVSVQKGIRWTPCDLAYPPHTRWPCALVFDVSAETNIKLIPGLDQELHIFLEALMDDRDVRRFLELAVFTTGENAAEVLPITLVRSIGAFATIPACGAVPLGEAVELALKRLEERKAEYKRSGIAYYQPWLVIISDGAPTDQWQAAAQKAMALSQGKRLVVLPVGVQGADLNILGQFSHRGAKSLDGLKFRELFQWLSASMARVSASNSTSASVQLPSTDSWGAI